MGRTGSAKQPFEQAIREIVGQALVHAVPVSEAATRLRLVARQHHQDDDIAYALVDMVYALLDSGGTVLGAPPFDDASQIAFARIVDEIGRQSALNPVEATTPALAEVLKAKKRFSEAIALLTDLAEHLRAIGDDDSLRLVLNNLGGTCLDDNRPDEARRYLLEALEFGPHLNAFMNLAMACYQLGVRERPVDKPGALRLFRQGYASAMHADFGKYLFHNGLAVAELELQLGNPLAAIPVFGRVLPLTQRFGEADSVPGIQGNLGLAYLQSGDWAQAEQVLNEAEQRGLAAGNQRAVLAILNNLADLAESRGDALLARDHLIHAEQLGRELGEDAMLARVLTNLGNSAWVMDDLPQAERSWREALDLAVAEGEHEIAESVLRSLDILLQGTYRAGAADALRARVSARWGGRQDDDAAADPAAGLDDVVARAERAGRVGNRSEFIKATLDMAERHRRLGLAKDYLGALELAGITAHDVGWLEQSWRIWSQLGDEYQKQQSHESALKFYRKATETLERIRWSVSKARYVRRPAQATRAYEGLIESALCLGDWETALLACERTKCQTRLQPLEGASPQSILDRLNELSHHAVLDLKYTEAGLVVFVVVSPGIVFRPGPELGTSPDVLCVNGSTRATALLFPRVDLSLLNRWDALGFTPTSANLVDGIKDIRWNDNILKVCGEIHTAFLGAIAGDLRAAGVGSITVIPDGILHRVPFHLVHSSIDGTASFLLDDFRISISPSWETVRARHHRRLDEHRFLLVACDALGNLPGVRHEIRAIQAILSAHLPPEQITVLDHDVTIERLCRLMDQHTVTHLACHGHFNVRDIAQSGLLLDDGTLTYEQIAAQRLVSGAQVVLSSCKGMLTDPKLVVENHVSAAGAFLQAGAQTVLASLTEVDDATTSDLMEIFYGTYVASAADDLSEAMRTAVFGIRHGATTSGQPPSSDARDLRPMNASSSQDREEDPLRSPRSWGSFATFGT